ncbi:uroporphyrinogen decarboxylase [Aestuariimicrobium soli]|uniref:uroporphyrinogen decarboxylase n=1 Tax=Aestuariimicrobium soli TaxID=2035834 RepID=UPI003EBB3424
MTASVEPALLAAAHQRQLDRLPVWFMRQAGRSLPEYRETRAGTQMLDSCFDADMVTEITLQPVRRHLTDGAVFFSDIMAPLKAAGIDLDIVPGTGPVVASPVRDARGLERVLAHELDPGALGPIGRAARQLTAALDPQVPLIGFAGAPFTLASYLVEGGPSKDHARAKAFMVGEPDLWRRLCAWLADLSFAFLAEQIAGGARIVQLFDSWAGSLTEADYRAHVAPHSRAVLDRLPADLPRIHFGVGTTELLPAMTEVMGEGSPAVIGVDWRTPLDVAARRVGGRAAVQGNLDPALLLAPWEVLADRVREVVRAGAGAPGHIFNLGHGVPPTTDASVLTRIVELVHTEGPALRAEARQG